MDQQRTEEELALLRRTTEDLSDVVARQGREIATLQRRMEMLLRRAAEQETDGGGGVVIGDERPPHY
jgi:SlyX protein